MASRRRSIQIADMCHLVKARTVREEDGEKVEGRRKDPSKSSFDWVTPNRNNDKLLGS